MAGRLFTATPMQDITKKVPPFGDIWDLGLLVLSGDGSGMAAFRVLFVAEAACEGLCSVLAKKSAWGGFETVGCVVRFGAQGRPVPWLVDLKLVSRKVSCSFGAWLLHAWRSWPAASG